MPDVPTSGVNGHVVSFPALHGSRSMLSLAPAARIVGSFASIATAGSFCLFCGNGVLGPAVTSDSPACAAAGAIASRASPRMAAESFCFMPGS